MGLGIGIGVWRDKLLRFAIKLGSITAGEAFNAGRYGWWYDIGDERSMFRDVAGKKRVRWNGDLVALVLDKSQGYSTKPELLSNNEFANGTTGWASSGSGSFTASKGEAVLVSGSGGGNYIRQPFATEAGKLYLLEVFFRLSGGAASLRAFDATGQIDINGGLTEYGSATLIFTARAAQTTLEFAVTSASSTVQVSKVTAQEIPGNHLYQSDPVLQPWYRSDGAKHWLTFDGVDDMMADRGLVPLTGTTPSHIMVAGQAIGSMVSNDGFMSYSGGELVNGAARALDFGSNTSLKVDSISYGVSLPIPDAALAPAVYEGRFGPYVAAAVNGGAFSESRGSTINTVQAKLRLGIGALTSGATPCRVYEAMHLVGTLTEDERKGIYTSMASKLDAPVPLNFNLLEGVDFREWTQTGAFGMSAVTINSFTNSATSGISRYIGTEVGKRYRVTISCTRGAGALRIYFSDSPTIATPAGTTDVPVGENRTLEIVADGPWITFRASVGDTTTVVTKLTVVKI